MKKIKCPNCTCTITHFPINDKGTRFASCGETVHVNGKDRKVEYFEVDAGDVWACFKVDGIYKRFIWKGFTPNTFELNTR